MTDATLTDSNDIGGAFMAQSQQADASDAIRAMRERFGPSAAKSVEGVKPAAKPEGAQAGAPQPAQLPPGTEIRPLSSGGFGVYKDGALVSAGQTYDDALATTLPKGQDGTLGRVFRGAVSAVKDVGAGIVETPRQAVAGAFDAVAEMGVAADSLGDWLNQHVIDLSVDIPSTGNMTADSIIRPLLNPAKGVAENTPRMDKARSTTGAMVRDVSQFVTGMAAGGKALRGAGLVLPKTAQMVATGAFADFAARSPDTGRLADLIEKQPELANPITAFLKADPNDNEAVKRFKNALEGAGLGLLSEGLVRSVKVVRAKLLAERGKPGVDKFAADPLADAKLQYGEIKPGQLGDSKTPLVSKKTPPTAKEKILSAVKAVETGVPDDIAAKGLVKVGDSGGKEVFINFARMETPDDVKKALGLMADAFAPEINKARAGREAPIVALRRQAAAIEASLPKPKDGTTRLWRGNRKGEVGTATRFTNDLAGIALPFKESYGGALSFVDVPTKDLKKFLQTGTAADGAEFIVTPEIAAQARAVKVPPQVAASVVQSNEATKELADNLGMTVEDVLARRKGQPFNAEEALAARRLWDASARKLTELAEIVAKPDATSVDQFNFRRAMAVHYAIQSEVIAARTETARALQAWSIPAGGSVEQARAVQQAIETAGGPEMTAEIARRLAVLGRSGANDPAALNSFVRNSLYVTTRDAVMQYWVNALLSSPKTHIVNMSSNTLVMLQQIYERKIAAGIGEVIGGGGVAPGEAIAMVHGLKEAMRDAFRFSWKSLKTGETGQWGGAKFDNRPEAISAQAFGLGDNAAGRTVDFIGKTINTPGRFLQAEDEFFKTIGYRMELHAQAVREVSAKGLTGEEAARAYKAILLNPPEHIRLAAADGALYSTFTNETGAWGKAILNARQKVPLLGFVLPFVKTPTNITRYAFERSPIAPLVGQWKADIAAGGARRDLALARMGTGTTIMLLAADYAETGLISGNGPDDSGEREALLRQGWQPYSIKVGERWYSYNRADPLGMLMGFAADMSEAIKRGEIESEEVDEATEIVAAGIGAIANTVVNKTYMQSIAGVMEMMTDPERYSSGEINQFLSSFVPAGVNAIAQGVDNTAREKFSTWDYVQARIPEFSKNLIPKRDLWGQPLSDRSGLGGGYNTLSPIAGSEVKDSPIDKEMQRLNVDFRRIGKKSDWDGVPVNFRDWRDVYDAYTKLAGNELKHPAWGLGAKDFLNQVVSGKHQMSEAYQMQSDGEDGGKSVFIRKWLTNYRELARRAILDDPKFADFANFIAERKTEIRNRRLPDIAR